MTEETEETGVPTELEATPERAKEVQTTLERAREAAESLKAQGRRPERILSEDIRTFINPTEPNCRYLVVHGTPRVVVNPAAPIGVTPMAERIGDVWAEFRSGVCVTENFDVIAWCEAHGPSEKTHEAYHKERGERPAGCRVKTGLCRDINDPLCAAWAEFKAQQIPRANQDATISPSLDIDALFERGIAAASATHHGEELVGAAKNTETARRRRRDG